MNCATPLNAKQATYNLSMSFDDVLEVVRVSIASMTKRFSIDQITGSKKLSDVDVTDDLAITELKTRTYRALQGKKAGKFRFNDFFTLMVISPSSTVNQAAQAGFNAYQGAFEAAG